MKIATPRLLPSFIAIALVAASTQWFMTQKLQAQDATEAPQEEVVEEAAPEIKEGKTLIDQFKAGGWAMYPLTLLSISGFGLIVYNFMAVKSGVVLNSKATEEIEKALSNVDIAKAKSICEESYSPITNIIEAGLHRVDVHDYDAEQVKEAIEEASAEELAGPYVFINYLSVIGSLSPMVGLLGTVSGMVKAFNVIEAEGAGSAQALAGNISEALITT
ncbi:MAG: MotA/TolQ/ExbB proton channel family protein, partial [Verrucomicrobiota bacterium]